VIRILVENGVRLGLADAVASAFDHIIWQAWQNDRLSGYSDGTIASFPRFHQSDASDWISTEKPEVGLDTQYIIQPLIKDGRPEHNQCGGDGGWFQHW
jgi:hypothetical protein